MTGYSYLKREKSSPQIGNLFLRTGITCRLADYGILHNYVVSLAPCKEHAVLRVIATIATQKQNRESRRAFREDAERKAE